MTPNHDATPREPVPGCDEARDPSETTHRSGLDAGPDEIDLLVARPGATGDVDGPIVVVATRPWSPPAAVLPALLVLLLAGGLTAYRAVGVEDWQGLFPESRQRLLARAGWSDIEAQQGDRPALNAPKVDPSPSRDDPPETAPVHPASPEPEADSSTADDDAEDSDEPPALPPVDTDADAMIADADAEAPSDPAESSLDDIQREVERRRAERQELARLKAKIEAEAPPPRRAAPGPDRAQMLAMIEAMKRRQLEAMDHALREMERQQSEWVDRTVREFGVPPGLAGGDDVFGPLHRRHAETIERAERDIARLRERMRRSDPFGREPLAGAFPPPHPFFLPPPPAPGLDFDPEAGGGRPMLPPGMVVPEGAEVRTFTGPDGSRSIILRWGQPPQHGGR